MNKTVISTTNGFKSILQNGKAQNHGLLKLADYKIKDLNFYFKNVKSLKPLCTLNNFQHLLISKQFL